MRRSRHRRRAQADRTPWSALVVACAMLALHVWQLYAPSANLIDRWGLVPAQLWQSLGSFADWWAAPDRWTPLSAVFVHINWLHLLGNLAFFWLFAQSIERRIGALRFLILVAVSGAVGNLFQVWQTPALTSSLVGASGATAGLFGAFMGLYPAARIGVVLPLGLYWQTTRVPGVMLFGAWLVIQFGFILASEYFDATAWWTHAGGFFCGLILTLIARILGLVRS